MSHSPSKLGNKGIKATAEAVFKATPQKYIFEEEGPFYLDELRESKDKLNRAKLILKTKSVGERSLNSDNRTKSAREQVPGLNFGEGSTHQDLRDSGETNLNSNEIDNIGIEYYQSSDEKARKEVIGLIEDVERSIEKTTSKMGEHHSQEMDTMHDLNVNLLRDITSQMA